MLTKDEFHARIQGGLHILDGATASNLMFSGMPRGGCTEEWILAHPEALIDLQRRYAQAGAQVIYAPTFQAQPIALERVGLHRHTEAMNAQLAALSRAAAPGCLIAGNLTTLAAFTDSHDPANFDLLLDNYRRQIRGLLEGGVDLLVGETLLYPQEAEAILTAAELEGAGAAMYSFVLQPDGSFLSGMEAGPVLRELELAGAAAVGFNCVAANYMLPGLVSKLRRHVKGPLLCKPNAGIPTIEEDGLAHYSMGAEEFGRIMADCKAMGAALLGGCCGTTPEHIHALA